MRFGAELQSAEKNKLKRRTRWRRKQGKVFTVKYHVTFPTRAADELERKITSAFKVKFLFFGFEPRNRKWTGYNQNKQGNEVSEKLWKVKLAD